MKFATRSTNAKVNEHQSNQTKRVEDEVQLKPKRQPYFLPLPWSQVTGHSSQFNRTQQTTLNFTCLMTKLRQKKKRDAGLRLEPNQATMVQVRYLQVKWFYLHGARREMMRLIRDAL